jgi:hypothetical protein
MKAKLTYIILLTLFGMGNAVAQNCNFNLIRTDPFDGETELRIDTRYDIFFSMSLYNKGEIYRIESNVIVSEIQYSALPAASKLDIKLGNGNTMTLASASIAEPAFTDAYTSYSMSYTVSKEQFQEIADNGIQYIRTHLQGETYYDYAMTAKETEKIKSNASCILNYQPGTTMNNSTTTPSGNFSMGLGTGLPIGNFADKTGSNYGGYAKTGFNMNYTVGIPIAHSNFGIAFMGSWFLNSFDINAYVNTLQSSDLSKSYKPSIGATHNDFYTGGFITSGLYATYPVNCFSFDFKLMGGIALCHMPIIDYQASDNSSYFGTGESYWIDKSTMSTAFAYDIGVDFRIIPKIKYVQVSPWRSERTVGIIVGVDLVSAKPLVNTTQEYNNNFANSTITNIVERIPVSMLNITLGFAYSF